VLLWPPFAGVGRLALTAWRARYRHRELGTGSATSILTTFGGLSRCLSCSSSMLDAISGGRLAGLTMEPCAVDCICDLCNYADDPGSSVSAIFL
jgi:hypothetical protein